METVFNIKSVFGSFLADGEVGNRFRFCEVQPVIERGETVIFDFEGVTNMTDSFNNACFTNLFLEHPDAAGTTILFRNVSPLIRVFLRRAVALGKQKAFQQPA